MPTTDHGVFVAAARHLLAEGWRRYGRSGGMLQLGDRRRIAYDKPEEMAHGYEPRLSVAELHNGITSRRVLDIDITSVRQAVDCLVGVGMLPGRLGSWNTATPRPPFAGPSHARNVRAMIERMRYDAATEG